MKEDTIIQENISRYLFSNGTVCWTEAIVQSQQNSYNCRPMNNNKHCHYTQSVHLNSHHNSASQSKSCVFEWIRTFYFSFKSSRKNPKPNKQNKHKFNVHVYNLHYTLNETVHLMFSVGFGVASLALALDFYSHEIITCYYNTHSHKQHVVRMWERCVCALFLIATFFVALSLFDLGEIQSILYAR